MAEYVIDYYYGHDTQKLSELVLDALNARNARALVQTGEVETWLLITSAFHMPRAMQSFEAVGWGDIIPYPVDYRTGSFRDGLGWNLQGNLDFLQMAIREMVGSLAYRLLKM